MESLGLRIGLVCSTNLIIDSLASLSGATYTLLWVRNLDVLWACSLTSLPEHKSQYYSQVRTKMLKNIAKQASFQIIIKILKICFSSVFRFSILIIT